MGLHHEHQCGEARGHAGPLGPDLPLDASTGESVQHEHPRGHEWRCHMGPVRRRTPSIVGEIQSEGSEINAGQGDARNERQDGCQERCPACPHGLTIWAVVRVPKVHQTKDDRGHHNQEAQDQVQQEHPEIKPALTFLALHGDRNQVHRVDHDQREQREDDGQHRFQTLSDGGSEFLRLGHGSILDRVSGRTTPTWRSRNYSPPCQRVRRSNSRDRPNSSNSRGGPGNNCSPSLVKRSMSLHQPRVRNTTR